MDPNEHATGEPTDGTAGPGSAGPAGGTGSGHDATTAARDGLLGEAARLPDAVIEVIAKLWQRSERAVTGIENAAVPAWLRRSMGEHRWIVSLAIIAAIVMQVTLPHHLALPPIWLLPTIGSCLLIGLFVANPKRIDHRSVALRAMSILLTITLSLANASSAFRLVVGLVRGTVTLKAVPLLLGGGAIWVTNVIVFALWYWELDREGPAARALGVDRLPDFVFPQMQTPELAPPDWEPQFLDYLYLSFTNATAFSPTDVIPYARWAKMTMMLQSIVSLSTVALVVARAVNILQ